MTTFSNRHIALPMIASGILLAGTAFGQAPAIQVLDRVQAFDRTAVLEIDFDDPASDPPFDVLLDEKGMGANFKACKLTATRGIYCLDDNVNDGEVVRNWLPGEGTGQSSILVYCDDPTLSLKTCTGATVDLGGTIWLAGQDRGKTHNLFKIEPVPIADLCPSGDRLIWSPEYCATLWGADKPLLIDLKSVDGDAAASFAPGKGVLGLEERKTIVYFVDNANKDSIVVASGKRDLELVGNEQLLSTALLQVVIPGTEPPEIKNYVLVTTTKDRILLVETDGSPDARPVFNIALERDPESEPCPSGASDDATYGIQSSPKSGFTYVTDSQYCQVLALQPVFDEMGEVERLDNVVFEDELESTVDLTLSIAPFSVLGPTVAPGEIINFGACGVGVTCPIVNVTNEFGAPAATLSGVQAIGDMILFQIENIPDCRYIRDFCFDSVEDGGLGLIPGDVIIDRKVSGDHPAAQLLNVTPLLPLEVTETFDDPLPDMWISNNYRAQFEKGYFFDAFFGVTNATFQGVYEIEVDVQALTGDERGCFPSTGNPTPPVNTPAAVLIAGYDVAVKVSEDFQSIDRSYIEVTDAEGMVLPDHEARLINSGCGTSRGSGDRWSFIPFDLGFTPDTFAPPDTVAVNDDAVFAKLLLSLFDDLEQSVNELACMADDDQVLPPLSDGQCMDFNAKLSNTLDKLGKCIDAAIAPPKDSVLNQTCQGYASQFGKLQSAVSSFTLAGQDPANRIGEAQARMIVIDNVYTNLFFPSIPADGFTGLSRN